MKNIVSILFVALLFISMFTVIIAKIPDYSRQGRLCVIFGKDTATIKSEDKDNFVTDFAPHNKFFLVLYKDENGVYRELSVHKKDVKVLTR